MHAGFWWGNLRGGDHLEGPGVDGGIILKWIHKEDQQDAHFFLIIPLNLSSKCFEQVTVNHQEEFLTSSLQYFTVRLKRSLVADSIQEDKLSEINY